jgi:hypothetical protein
LGLTGYYRKFIKSYGVISKPLTELLRKGAVFVWNPRVEEAFSTLKKSLVSAPVLALPDFSQPFMIVTDACDTGIGAVLMQKGHPLAFVSKALGPRNRGLSVYEKEYMAILLAVETWRPYLQMQQFTIKTDQKSLSHIADQRLHTPWQQKAYTKLMGHDYEILYKKGSDNTAADALSRRPHQTAQSFAISGVLPSWLQEIFQGYPSDASTMDIIQQLVVDPKSKPPYTLVNGLLRHKGCIWIGEQKVLQDKIFQAFHDSPIGGHSGFPVTYNRIHSLFKWKGMKSYIKQRVQSCLICKKAKPERINYPGLLSPLPVPRKAWETVTMDFISGLPSSEAFDCLMVVIDKFTKYGHFIPIKHPYTAPKIDEIFLENVYRLHGMPEFIVSDRDPVFTSALWQHLIKRTGAVLNMSTSYHPETDGQTERVNQQIDCFLRCFISAHPKKWKNGFPCVSFGTT